jgi:transketolase
MKNYIDFSRSKNKQPEYMRDIFIDSMFVEAKKNKDLYFATPDMGAPSLDQFRKYLPKQFIHCGICEQHMISMAAGLTLMGKKIICYAMAPFITSRCYEQIKCSVAAMSQPVNLVGIGVGLGYADAGPTHYTTEDIAIMRVFPNIEIITPCDEISTKKTAKYILKKNKFRFIRLDRDALPPIYNNENQINFDIGFSEILKGNKKKCLLTSGYLIHKCKDIIKKKKLNITLVDLFKIKPLSKELLKYLNEYNEIITIEEQWLDGGFGAAILEFMSENNMYKKIKRFGLDKIYYFQNGGREYLHKKHGLDIEKILVNIC